VENRNFGDFGSFSVGRKRRICLSAGCASATDAIGSDIDIHSGICGSINDLLDFDTVIG
jgi:hypothetical protein